MKFYKVIVFIAVCTFTGTLAQTTPSPLITVSGKGQIKIVPDIVDINLGVETTDVSLSVAKARNDWKINEILNFLEESGMESSDIRTYNIQLDERKNFEKRSGLPDTLVTKYFSSQSIKLTLHDVSRFSKIVEGLINSGITKITGIQFTTSRMDSLSSETRLLALRNARERASEMAKELGKKIGDPYFIREGNDAELFGGNFGAEYGFATGGIVNNSIIRTNQLAEGEIEITQYVTVSFYLK